MNAVSLLSNGPFNVLTISTESNLNLKSLSPEKTKLLERLADKAYVMTKLTQDLLVSTGMEPKEKIDGRVKSNPHYVHLFREETDYEGSHYGTGSGFS